MPNISSRHHYLPEFYLSQFTNESNQFYIYLVKENRFKKNGQLFSPQSHFFEKDANTIFKENDKFDFIENSYSRIDNMASKVFQKVSNSEEDDFGIIGNDIALLQWFVSTLFWRLPQNKGKLLEIIENKTLQQLGLNLINKDSNLPVTDLARESNLRKDPNFFKLVRKWIPDMTYPEVFECSSPLTILPFPKGLPKICSDNPLILRNSGKFELYRDDFILPLSADKLLIRTPKIKNVNTTITKIEIDTLILMQAEEFVCCTDLKYPELLKNFFCKHYNSLDKLRESIFLRVANE